MITICNFENRADYFCEALIHMVSLFYQVNHNRTFVFRLRQNGGHAYLLFLALE